jgi:thymidylate synthase (FAD)
MTADDFEDFASEAMSMGGAEDYPDFVSKLWEWRNTPTHDTPFNHSFISFEVKAPIFVRAQLVKHEYLIMSEFSRRYITDGIEFYEPDYWRKAAENKKQGSLEGPVVNEEYGDANAYTQEVYEEDVCRSIEHIYKLMLEIGVAPEQARMVLPQSTMTEWTWSGTLGAFAKMCQLRLHPDAQYESRLVAQQVYDYLKEYWPVSAKALVEGPDV